MSINRTVISANLTRAPELTVLPNGTAVCSLRVGCNTRRKNANTGEWEQKPNFFDVTVWGARGENCSRFLRKGSFVMIDGRLEWEEWEGKDGGKRERVGIIADSVDFGPRANGGGETYEPAEQKPYEPATTDEQDIPF
jgi:single-strand DNA-binding protein